MRKHIEFTDVVYGLPAHNRMDAARVVADHSTQRAVRVRCWVRSKCKVMFLPRIPQCIKHNARLHSRIFLLIVQLDDLIHVLREVKNYGNIAALPRETRASTPREHGSAKLPANSHGFNAIVLVSWDDHTNRDLPIVGPIGCVQSTAAVVEAHLAPDVSS